MKKQSLIKGTLILGLAGMVAKLLGMIFRIPLTQLIGDEGLGYYQMSYPLYMFFIGIASGVPVAISKMVSERNALGDKYGTVQVLRKAILFMVILGGGFSLFMIIFAKNIVSFFKWDEKSYYSLWGIAWAPIFISIMTAFRGFFQGLQNMNPTAVSQIIEQIGRVIIGLALAYVMLPKGIEYSAGGAAFGAAAGGVLGGIYLIFKYISIRKELNLRKIKSDKAIMGQLLYIAIPISLGATVGTIMSLIDSALVPQKLLEAGFTYKQSTTLYGQLTGKAFVLVNVPLTLSMALCASLVPIIAEAYMLKNRIEIINKVDKAIKFSMIISLPAMVGLFFMASPILNLIFPGYAEGAKILKYLSISIPFIALAQTSTSILQGVGKYIVPVINLLLGCIIKVILTIILVPIPSLNIYGAVIGTIAGYITASLLNIYKMKKTLNISMPWYDLIIKPAYAAILMIIAVVFIYMYVYNNTMSTSISCVISILIGVILYAGLIMLFGILDYKYVKGRFLKR